MGIYDFTIASVIDRNARVHADRIGWICGEDKITHRQFSQTAGRVANGLVKAGVAKGDRIGIFAQNSMAYFYLYGAAAKIGAVVLPINFRLSPEEIEYIITDGAPKLLFVGSEYVSIVEQIRPALRGVREFFTLDAEKENFTPFSSLMENSEWDQTGNVSGGDGFVIVHTAAVSGKPRGALLSHRGLISANVQNMLVWDLRTDDCHLCMLPLFHIGALGTALGVMHAGGVNVVMPKFDPERALKHIQDDKVTLFIEFPPMLQTLFDRNQKLKCDLTSLRVVGGLDQPDMVKKFEEVTGGTFWTAYGQTELCGLVSYGPYFERPGSAGLPSFMAEVKIMDETGNFRETGQDGEIVVRGPMVFNGYWNLAQDTEYTFRGGWHHTGDQGHFDADGYLWYTGRLPEKELIKPGGENVYPAEVETAILAHPLVEAVCVIGVADAQWGEAIKAVCVLKPEATLEEAELIEFVASRIARFKKPKYVTFVSELPKTKQGLIDRQRVKADYA